MSFNGGHDFATSGLELFYEIACTIERIVPTTLSSGVSNQLVTLIGRNFRRNQDLRCQFGRQLQNYGYFMSSTSVACLAPVNVKGTVMVSLNTNGNIFENVGLPVNYAERLNVNLHPNAGPVQGGTQVVVSLNGLIAPPAQILAIFGNSRVFCDPLLGSWSCLSPKLDSGNTPQNVSVRISSTDRVYDNHDHTFLYYAKPDVYRVWPTVGATNVRTTITLVGSNFMSVPAIRCRFGEDVSKSLETKLLSTSSIECAAPLKSDPSVVKVFVSLNDGCDFTETGDEFRFLHPPSLSALLPSSGPESGAGKTITLVGSGFLAGANTQCRFGISREVPALVESSTHAKCVLPSNMRGTVLVSIANYGLLWSTESIPFTIYSDVNIHHLTPSQGTLTGGTTVTVNGAFFNMSQGTFRFGARYTRCLISSISQALCVAPVASKSGLVVVQLTTSLFSSAELLYEYLPNMQVSAIVPSRGLFGIGTVVHLHGEGFVEMTTCRFGSYRASALEAYVLSSSLMRCLTPTTLEIGKTTIEVSANGDDFTSNNNQFSVESVPVVHEIVPSTLLSGRHGQK